MVMFTTHRARTLRAALALPAVALAGFGVAAATSAADPSDASARHHGEQQRLVVRGEATIADSPCPAGLCLELQDGTFRGTPVGTGAYGGSIELLVAETFPNGEGGICAPMRGEIVLGQGSPDRLVLAVDGDSCQDGAGDPTTTSFTGLARFTVKHGTGTYAKASGSGLATFSEDAADQDRMTLIGSISR
jgi:hypothetical protein